MEKLATMGSTSSKRTRRGGWGQSKATRDTAEFERANKKDKANKCMEDTPSSLMAVGVTAYGVDFGACVYGVWVVFARLLTALVSLLL